MRIPRKGEKGFTLIELLIVVAILGVLAAVVIPNVSRFIGRGESEATDTEFANIQAAVSAMMIDNELIRLLNPVDGVAAPGLATQNMGAFPDTSLTAATGAGDKDFDVAGTPYELADQDGYYLYQHDRIGGGTTGNLTNYVAQQFTASYYTVDEQGTVTQWVDAAKTEQLNP